VSIIAWLLALKDLHPIIHRKKESSRTVSEVSVGLVESQAVYHFKLKGKTQRPEDA